MHQSGKLKRMMTGEKDGIKKRFGLTGEKVYCLKESDKRKSAWFFLIQYVDRNEIKHDLLPCYWLVGTADVLLDDESSQSNSTECKYYLMFVLSKCFNSGSCSTLRNGLCSSWS